MKLEKRIPDTNLFFFTQGVPLLLPRNVTIGLKKLFNGYLLILMRVVEINIISHKDSILQKKIIFKKLFEKGLLLFYIELTTTKFIGTD